ncbi:hypothetical protein VOI32_37795 [Paraburkholderia caribensis]|uniref:Uncharacterized protein n=1 Tax=Paraburkholderia caribensis TaxID=75105 RepID=A0ABV0E9V5_9BURK|nr:MULTISPECIES: hypothetical protein [Paraburkholderia]MCO4882357.1 hypothetical protein [Paraburkholderia caribensis]
MNTLKNLAPIKVIIFFTTLFVVLTGSASLIGVSSPWISLNENQVLYLFSTSAQVLAGVYGLTLTAYIFFQKRAKSRRI